MQKVGDKISDPIAFSENAERTFVLFSSLLIRILGLGYEGMDLI